MSTAVSPQPDGAPAATRRILMAARALVARGGAAEVSMGAVATEAGVSKALIHYHFKDKDSLLVALTETVATAVFERARDASQRAGTDVPRHALDAYWASLVAELEAGDLPILASLAQCASERVRAMSRHVAAERRALAVDQIARLFAQLELRPGVPSELMADTVTAFVDGLAAAHALAPDQDPRPAFDVLWLALLTLAE